MRCGGCAGNVILMCSAGRSMPTMVTYTRPNCSTDAFLLAGRVERHPFVRCSEAVSIAACGEPTASGVFTSFLPHLTNKLTAFSRVLTADGLGHVSVDLMR